MRVTIQEVAIPVMSSIGYGRGVDDLGSVVVVAGDHRPMRDIGEAIRRGEAVTVDVSPWQILGEDDLDEFTLADLFGPHRVCSCGCGATLPEGYDEAGRRSG